MTPGSLRWSQAGQSCEVFLWLGTWSKTSPLCDLYPVPNPSHRRRRRSHAHGVVISKQSTLLPARCQTSVGGEVIPEMKGLSAILFALMSAALLLAGCGGGGGTRACWPPPTWFPAQMWLSYPIPGSTAVATSIGNVILANTGGSGPVTVTLSSTAGASTIDTSGRAPSPLPSPYATPGASSTNMLDYLDYIVPTLSHATTYTVTAAITNETSVPPCQEITTQTLGTFTTI